MDKIWCVQLLSVAKLVRAQSDDPKPGSTVGAAIGDRFGLQYASANRLCDENLTLDGADDPNRYHYIEHAERAAIYGSVRKGVNLLGMTMACTRFPCSDCARAIVSVGIARLILPKEVVIEDGPWKESQIAAQAILAAGNIQLIYL